MSIRRHEVSPHLKARRDSRIDVFSASEANKQQRTKGLPPNGLGLRLSFSETGSRNTTRERVRRSSTVCITHSQHSLGKKQNKKKQVVTRFGRGFVLTRETKIKPVSPADYKIHVIYTASWKFGHTFSLFFFFIFTTSYTADIVLKTSDIWARCHHAAKKKMLK